MRGNWSLYDLLLFQDIVPQEDFESCITCFESMAEKP